MPTTGAVMYVGIAVYAKIADAHLKFLGYVPTPLMVNGMPVMVMNDKRFDPNATFILDDSGNSETSGDMAIVSRVVQQGDSHHGSQFHAEVSD